MPNDVILPAPAPETEGSLASPGWLSSGWRLRLVTPAAQRVAALAGLLGSVLVALSAVAVGPLPAQRPQPWWYDLPGSWVVTAQVSSGVTPLDVVFYGGMVLMTLAWLVIGLGVRAGMWRIRQLWVVGAAWALPWLFGPVALSTDLYTYIGQGLVAHAGLNPYANGPAAAALPGPLRGHMTSVWLHTPSPYGPLFLGLDSVISPLVHSHLVYAVVLLRLVEVFGLALAAVSLPKVARSAGVDPAWATWFGVTSPLVLASCVLSGHNDGLMIGLLMAGLALFADRPVAAIAACTLAMLVKIPAAVGVAVLTLAWAWRAERWRDVAARLGVAALVSVAVAGVVSMVTGVGTNWLNFAAVSSPTASAILFTPAVAVAVAVIELCRATGIDFSVPAILSTVRGIAVAFAALFTLGVLMRLPKIGVTRALGAILIVVVLGSPVTWPWYLCWPLLILGATTLGRRSRIALITLAALVPFLVDPHGTVQPIQHPGALVIAMLTLGLVVIAVRWIYRTVLTNRAATQVS